MTPYENRIGSRSLFNPFVYESCVVNYAILRWRASRIAVPYRKAIQALQGVKAQNFLGALRRVNENFNYSYLARMPKEIRSRKYKKNMDFTNNSVDIC
uniref:Uncharacterized protein n=1 Tax=Romanomermis culicivorax TaxID=13658 RepID=A0A915HII7_ROMCU